METFYNGLLILLLTVLRPSNSLFVPEQLPTLLSFIYTNIPPIRKGIDSRVGFGFRLGPNADVQVMLELGPQQNTAPIGPQKADGNSKRETRFPSYGYRPKRPLQATKGSWLEAWRQQQEMIVEGQEDDVGVMPAPAMPVLDRDIISHLQQLYKEQPADRTAKNVKLDSKLSKRAKAKARTSKQEKASQGNTQVRQSEIESEEMKNVNSLKGENIQEVRTAKQESVMEEMAVQS